MVVFVRCVQTTYYLCKFLQKYTIFYSLKTA
ncbi:hypothetical protein predicted by Glimmer/Critica [Acetobacter ghanensis]|uniref:Uncharacterized protein n=1 Tax=Acetobacter ghanensis TaxID=431306 RepID=A0A0U5F428_9PROT|nr:hypothetical protein predicted by Glimmer/Critica [Acetobacter ghanensis]